MKNMNMKKRYWTMNLQVFAGDGGDDDPGDEGGDDDDEPGDDDDDSDDDDEPEENEKKFSQKDVDDAVKKRLAREKRKWQREQQKKAGKKPNGKVKTGENSEKEDDDTETQELRDKAAKADEMEMKWTCLEHDVDKACVDDVLALARVHMAKDEDIRDKNNAEVQLAATLFYDCRNSRPSDVSFEVDQVVDFNGQKHQIKTVETLYDNLKLHHYEIGMVRYGKD